MPKPEGIVLRTATDVLVFDRCSAQLVSFRGLAATELEFVCSGVCPPVFVVQYLDADHRFGQLTSQQAEDVQVDVEWLREQTILTATFRRLAGLEIDVTVTVRAAADDRFSHWSLGLRNGADMRITDVQFPFLVLPYHLGGMPGSEALVWPINSGILLRSPRPDQLAPDCPHTWQMRPENGNYNHYPGHIFAQFLAYHNDRAGIFASCLDACGRIKLIIPVHHEPGLRLGFAHVGDWPVSGERSIEYDVIVGSFQGDWYDAAELYRQWSLQQPWAQAPLHTRVDLPSWLLDSPPHIILRMQGELDVGPTTPNHAFLPYAKAIPMLEEVAQRAGAPLVPVIMSWERPGPWIYPDCFPPVGGEKSLREFVQLAWERGWHVGTFCNGTRWVTGHYWSGYDGEDFFAQRDGGRCVCRAHDGALWEEGWSWRPSYSCCLGVPMTREIALEFVRTLVGWGLDWIQFLDQNVGCCTLPCFAGDHCHPSTPGHWMTDSMHLMLDSFRELAAQELERSGGVRQIVFSVERPPNEYFMPYFPICDARVVPPGHGHPAYQGQEFIPLFHYLYHEFVLLQGGFGLGPEPYHLPIRNAYNLVIGQIPGAVLKDNGQLLNRDTENWAAWGPEVGSNEDALQMLRAATALRRGPAREFLVYGRMQPPAALDGIRTIRWQYGGHVHRIPAVFHAAWDAPDGRLGLVLANWTTRQFRLRVEDGRLGSEVAQHLATDGVHSAPRSARGGGISITLPPLSCMLLESRA
jgi:hypothetical protein